MIEPRDIDVCCRCGTQWWEHTLAQPSTPGRELRDSRCPPARFTPLDVPELEPTACTEVVQHTIDYANSRARGLHVLHTALGIWEDYLAAELAKDGRPQGQMEELIRKDREALNDLLHRLL